MVDGHNGHCPDWQHQLGSIDKTASEEGPSEATCSNITVAGSLLTEKYSSFCTCSVRVLCELGSSKGTNCRSKEDRAAISTSKMGSATVMLDIRASRHPRSAACGSARSAASVLYSSAGSE